MRHLPRGHQRALVSAPFCLVWSVSAAVLATEADSPLAKEIRQAQDWAKSAFAKPTARTETASTSKSVSSLEVDDGGNGRERDQCTWADASVTLDDGTIQFLDEIPLDSGRRTQQTAAPFSFTYGGVSSEELLPAWEYSFVEEPVKNGSRRTISYKCPKTGMRLECLVTTYSDAAGVDWVVYLTNEATEDTPLIDRLLPLHATLLETRPDEQVTLRSSKGDDFSPSSFMPHDEPIALNQIRQFRANGGRSSDGEGGGAFPFFNVLGANGGWILAVGWSGQWSAEFVRESDGSLTASAGMETTHFRLRPGERVRTPRIVLHRYLGDGMIHGHNRFRQMMLKHYVQWRDGQPAAPPVCHNTAATVYRSGKEATEENQLAIIEKAAMLGTEAYWMDAYWYPRPWHTNVGNWNVRPNDFPRGLKPLGDAAHQAGMTFVLWFEPERVHVGTEFDREHPEYLSQANVGGNRLYNLGDPNARKFLTDFLDARIKEWGVDMYRNDFNLQPLPFWQAADKADRQGITEMQYIEGLYEMWAELLRRNPHITIDNCASGGRRIDIEINSLSYPLWRSDFNDIGEGLKGPQYWPQMAMTDQNMFLGLALYIPFQAGPLWDMQPYSFRSAMTSSVVLYERILHEEFPDELAKQGIAELKELRPLFLGDVYPLTKLSTSQAVWHAYQLARADLGQGCALFFRRPDCPKPTCQVQLHNIDLEAFYMVSQTGETYTKGKPKKMKGRDLARLPVQMDTKPGSILLRYRKVGP